MYGGAMNMPCALFSRTVAVDYKPDTQPVVDELNRLDSRIDAVVDLNELKPIFYRLEEINREHSADFDVQMLVSDVKQHLMARGMYLKQQGAVPTASNPVANSGFQSSVPPPPPSTPAFGRSTPGQGTPPLPGPQPFGAAPAPANEPFPPQFGRTTPPPVGPPEAATPYPPPPVSGYPPPPLEPAPFGAPPPPPGPQPASDPFSSAAPMATSSLPSATLGPQAVYVPPVRTPTPPPVGPEEPQPPVNWKKPVLIGGGIGLVIVLAIVGAMYLKNRKPPAPAPLPASAVAVNVSTVPPGADIRINDQSRCKSNCRVDLTPGNYNLLATLPGYEQAFQNVTVQKGQPLTLSLTLTPQAPSLKILTDLGNDGKVLMDGNPAGAMQDGQMVLDRMPDGQHQLKIMGAKGAEATFSFQVSPGAAPAMQGPITAKNVAAVVAIGMGNQVRVASSVPHLKVALDGNAAGEAGPDGVSLDNVSPGDHELTLSDGKDERKVTITVGAAPFVTAWVNANTAGGTLVINAGEDGATVYIDGKAYPRKTRRGQLWVPNLAPKEYKVKVVKQGFQDAPEQTASINKGAETRLVFKLSANPQIAVLHITGGTPGAQVLIDNQSVGQIGADGSLSYSGVGPGSHSVEIRREQYTPKTLTQNFRAGETVELTGDAVVLERATGTLRLAVTPKEAQVTIKRSDENRANPITAGSHPLTAGTYTLTGKAPGYTDATVTVQVKPGDVATAELKLNKEAVNVPKTPAVRNEWERPNEWSNENGWLVHRGGNFVPYAAKPSTGVFTFTVQLLKGGVFHKHIQWRVGYVDEKNYVNFQLDKKSLESKIVTNGKQTNRPKIELDAQEPFMMQVEITPETVITRMHEGGQWVVVDRLTKAGVNDGKFGFYIPGSDEIAISNFSFSPR